MRITFLSAVCAALLAACSNPKPVETPVETAPPQAEFADQKYVEIGKQGLANLSKGDVDTWMNVFADNAKYYWSSRDSVVGKPAIAAYWKDRRGNVIDSISFAGDIWFPIRINQPQKGPDRKGVWLLSWYEANVKYKNGGKATVWIHTIQHFDESDKVDQVVQYFDREPLTKALAGKPKK